MGDSEFALIGNARGSFLYGATKFDIGIDGLVDPGEVNIDTEDHMMQVWEFQLGGEWARERSNGSRIFVQTLYEGQAWEWAPTLGLGGLDVGFTGFTCRFGIDR